MCQLPSSSVRSPSPGHENPNVENEADEIQVREAHNDADCGWKVLCSTLNARLQEAQTKIVELEKTVATLSEAKKELEVNLSSLRQANRTLRQNLKRKTESLQRKRAAQKGANEQAYRKKRRINCNTTTENDLLLEIRSRYDVALRGIEFSSKLKDFSYQVHFFSLKAYNFIRKSFDNKLPHPRTLPRWTDHIEVKPGETILRLHKNLYKYQFFC